MQGNNEEAGTQKGRPQKGETRQVRPLSPPRCPPTHPALRHPPRHQRDTTTATRSPHGSRPTRTPATPNDDTPHTPPRHTPAAVAARDANPSRTTTALPPCPPDGPRPTDATTNTGRRRPRQEQALATTSPIPGPNDQTARARQPPRH